MTVNFKSLKFGETYERPLLAKLWGYQSFHAISKGVVTPANTNYIVFFVTKDKQEALTQYNDYIDRDMLFWEGEEKHSSDKRVVDASKRGSCSVTGLQNVALLRASHIKPWKDSNNQERLNPFNGFLLIPDYDFLFDKGYIAFKNNGNMVISNRLFPFARKVFDVSDDLQLRNVFPENKEYLDFHRDKVFV